MFVSNVRRVRPVVQASVLSALWLAGASACSAGPNDDGAGETGDAQTSTSERLGSATDIAQALSALPEARVLALGPGGRPRFVTGNLGRSESFGPGLDLASLQTALAPAVARLAPAFGARSDELQAVSAQRDALGSTHVRYVQWLRGLPVVGGELVVHVDASGGLYAANGHLGALASVVGSERIAPAAAERAALEASSEVLAQGARFVRSVYFASSEIDGPATLAREVELTGTQPSGLPVRDLLYVDAQSGAVLERHPQIHDLLQRELHDAKNGTTLPGALVRTEGQAATADNVVNANYEQLGVTYQCYRALFGRDSYDNAGAKLVSTVHYSKSYVNAYWNGTQMVYGDGDGTQASSLAVDLDVTAHELTHAVTEKTANLVYRNESGALNEAISDIFQAVCSAWKTGAVDGDTWRVGEAIWTPATPGDALRYMDNPTQDGQSKDYYPERYTGVQDNGGVHLNSGIANLAFKLLVTGGTHPRAKTAVQVAGLGMERAAQIFYRALSTTMTSSTNFEGARNATAQAAAELYGSAAAASVQQAWDAVGVPGGTDNAPVDATPLTNGVTVTGLGGAKDSAQYFKLQVPTGASQLRFTVSGGTGDVDLYVRYGDKPTTGTFDCRPYKGGNAEECSFSAPRAGTWFVMLSGYRKYSGVSLVGAY